MRLSKLVDTITVIMDCVFIVFAIYGIIVFRRWDKVAKRTDKMLEEIKIQSTDEEEK
jgi:hypothetical protein